MRSSFRRVGLTVVSFLVIAAGVFAQQRPQVPGAIRSKVVLVPVDVRVLDRDGNPVTDLRQEDFRVFEEEIEQLVGHFASLSFSARPGDRPEPVLRRGPGLESSPAAHRTFLIVLGRGRLQYPAKGLDAVRDFVRARLLPQDLVAVQAYGRVTNFMTERAPVLRMLEHYEAQHERLEALLDHWFSGPWMNGLEASPGIERRIAAFFEAPGLPEVRRLAALDLDGESPFEERARETSEANRFLRGANGPFKRDFVYEAASRDDSAKLSAAIEFLRYYEGEKHVIFIAEDGLVGGTFDEGNVIAAKAADARVSVSIIRTGGMRTSWARPSWNQPPQIQGSSPLQMLVNADARAIAEETGGVASAYKYASQTIDRLDRATRHQYLLGYYPANQNWDGERRRIRVDVNRPGVTVLHRHAYFARENLVPFDHRAFTTHARIAGAAAYRVALRDVGVSLTGNVTSSTRDAWQVRVDVSIDPSTIAFEEAGGRHVASVDVAVFVDSRGGRQVGEIRKRIDVKLEPGTYARTLKDGVKFETTIDLKGQPRYLKAVVYDYARDKLGSALAQIR